MNRPAPNHDALPVPNRRRGWQRPIPILFVGIAAFIVIVTALAELRALELTTTTWDLGIYQQALASAAHGGTFYESPDIETGGPASFLQIHSAFVLYALVPVYAAAPTALTLFVVQSAVVAIAALPLYRLTLALTGAERRALALGVLYLGGAPIITSSLYDFHAEAFVPVVLFTVAYLWQQRRYRWGTVAALIGFAALEVIPVLLFALAAFFLALAWTDLARPAVGARATVREWGGRVARLLRDPGAWPTWGLLVGSAVAYYVILGLRMHYLSAWFGFPSFPSHASGYVIGGDPASLGLALGNLGVGFFPKASYWILLFALVGGLPLWFRRSLLLVAPWMAFTFLTGFLNFTVLGFQYGFVAATPLYLGAAWGLTRFRWPTAAASPGISDGGSRGSPDGRWRSLARPTTVAAVILLAANLAFTPLNPLLSNNGTGAAYNLTLSAPVSLDGVHGLLGLLPGDAQVLASYDLFPLVANDLNAYTLFWGPNPNLELPFNLTHLPDYVVISQSRFYTAPPWLTDTLYAPEDFGLRAVAWQSPVGAVLLFEHAYSGPLASWGSAPTFPVVVPAAAMVLTANMKLVPNSSVPGGGIALSVNGATGELLQTIGMNFPTGTYRIAYRVLAYPFDRSIPRSPSEVVFNGGAVPFAQPFQAPCSATFGMLSVGGYVTVNTTLVVTEPAFDVAILAYAADGAVAIKVASIEVDQVG